MSKILQEMAEQLERAKGDPEKTERLRRESEEAARRLDRIVNKLPPRVSIGVDGARIEGWKLSDNEIVVDGDLPLPGVEEILVDGRRCRVVEYGVNRLVHRRGGGGSQTYIIIEPLE